MKTERYWFYLEPFVYIRVIRNDFLLYNTLTGRMIQRTDAPELVEMLLKLEDETNLFALELTGDDLKKEALRGFVQELREEFMGDIIDTAVTKKKPFLLSPHWDVDKEADLKRGDEERTFDNADPDSYISLDQLTFYINGTCNAECSECGTAYKQFPWCTTQNKDCTLSPQLIKKILDETRLCNLKRINLLGGNPAQYQQMDQLASVLNESGIPVHLYVNFFHLQQNQQWLETINNQWHLHLMVNASLLNQMETVNLLEKSCGLNPEIVFLLQEEADFIPLEQIIQRLDLTKIAVQPFFSGNNLDFFKENVFTTMESLGEDLLNIDVIRSRKNINTPNYGQLFITNNGDVFSNLNAPPLGNIDTLTMREAVIDELTTQGNWLRVRRRVDPCKHCLLDAVCPPLSNLETVAGIFNSCNMRQ